VFAPSSAACRPSSTSGLCAQVRRTTLFFFPHRASRRFPWPSRPRPNPASPFAGPLRLPLLQPLTRGSRVSPPTLRRAGARLGVGVLTRLTYPGVPEVVDCEVEDHDRETENSKVCTRTRDTRFIQVHAAKVANPTSCLGDQVWRPALGVGLFRCSARYPTLLYIVQGRVPSRLQGRSPSRITQNES
jgi:hypothetical protein